VGLDLVLDFNLCIGKRMVQKLGRLNQLTLL